MATPQPIKARVERKLPRVAKFCRQWASRLTTGQHSPARPVFVLGAQRSGTRLPLHVMERSRDIITYNEGSDPFFSGVLLKDDEQIRRTLGRMPFPVVVLKPICESHRAAELLSTFEGSSIVWIYRDYRDTVNSAVIKWQTATRHVKALAAGDLEAAGWRAGGLTAEKLDLVSRLYHDDMSLHAANAILWYLRTSLFFDTHVASDPRTLLVKYEDLVRNPDDEFPRLFRFLNCPFRREYLAGVYASSVSSKPFPAIPVEITQLCEDLMARLDSFRAAHGELAPAACG